MSESPEFKLVAFQEDIGTLICALDALDIKYILKEHKVAVKLEGETNTEPQTIQIPMFNTAQLLGRMMTMFDALQSKFEAGGEFGVPRCPLHGVDGHFMFFGEMPRCLDCLFELVTQLADDAGILSGSLGVAECGFAIEVDDDEPDENERKVG